MAEGQIHKEHAHQFRNFAPNNVMIASLILGGYIFQLILFTVLGFLLINYEYTFFTITLCVCCVILIAFRLRGINNIVHECCHNSFTCEKKHNYMFGKIASAILLKSFHLYRQEHRSHHAWLGDYEKDMDFNGLEKFKLEESINKRVILRHALTPLLGIHIPKYLSVINFSLKDGWISVLIKWSVLLILIILAWLEPMASILFIVIPYVWVYTAICYWTDCIDHGGILKLEGNLQSSRNFIVPRLLRYVLFPRNDCYHLIHHLFPAVPVKYFDICHQVLMSNHSYCFIHTQTNKAEV